MEKEDAYCPSAALTHAHGNRNRLRLRAASQHLAQPVDEFTQAFHAPSVLT